MLILSEADIEELLLEAKDIPEGLSVPVKLTEKNRHKRREYQLKTEHGNTFVVKVRQSSVNPMNFSVVLGYMLPGSYTVFRLRRYNGKSHHHTNNLERESFYDFHVHMATVRYQIPGFDEDHFAVRTDRYYDLDSAVRCLLTECGFRSPLAGMPLFENT